MPFSKQTNKQSNMRFSGRSADELERDEVVAWLEAFALAVRERDYTAGRKLMDPSCVGFGTVAGRVISLDELIEKQWKSVWGRTKDFRFDLDKAVIRRSDTFIICCMLWSSQGLDGGGGTFARHGRSTIVLRSTPGQLLGVHTHFSMMPGSKRS